MNFYKITLLVNEKQFIYWTDDIFIFQTLRYFLNFNKTLIFQIENEGEIYGRVIKEEIIAYPEEQYKQYTQIYKKIVNIDINTEKKGEQKIMKKKKFNIEYGKITDDSIAISLEGIAFKDKNGDYVVYNSQNNELINVNDFVFHIKLLFKMPSSLKDLKENDIIIYNNEYLIIKKITEDYKEIIGINPLKGEKVNILPQRNILGTNYVTKIINLCENNNLNSFAIFNTDSKENSFNAINPMLYTLLFNNNNEDNDDFSSFIEMMLLNNFISSTMNKK